VNILRRAELEREVLRIARNGEFDCGTNGIGIINIDNGFVVPFPSQPEAVRKGKVSLLVQSGGVS